MPHDCREEQKLLSCLLFPDESKAKGVDLRDFIFTSFYFIYFFFLPEKDPTGGQKACWDIGMTTCLQISLIHGIMC